MCAGNPSRVWPSGAGGSGHCSGCVGWGWGAARVTLLTDVFVLSPQNVRIDPTSLSFNMWKEIPVPFYLSVYFFDVVNPSAILSGEKPQVRERGPYVYR